MRTKFRGIFCLIVVVLMVATGTGSSWAAETITVESKADSFNWRTRTLNASEQDADLLTIEGSIKLIRGGAGILWGMAKEPQENIMAVYVTKEKIYLINYDKGKKTSSTAVISEAVQKEAAEKKTFKMTVRLDVKGGKVRCYLDGVLALTASDIETFPELTHVGAFVGVYGQKKSVPSKAEFYPLTVNIGR